MESTGAIEIVAIDENPAVGQVGSVFEDDPVIMPVVSPVSPPPAKTAKEAESEAEAPRQTRPRKVQSWIPIPAGPYPNGISIYEPGIVLWHVNNLRLGWFAHNGLSLLGPLFLRCALRSEELRVG